MADMMKSLLWALLIIASPLQALAEPDEELNQAYFTIQDKARKETKTLFESPLAVFSQGAEAFFEVARNIELNLLKWTRHPGNPPFPSENYDRKKHFGTWVYLPDDGTCYNTRAKALIRDSKTPVKFKESNPCMVDSGTWEDPYTGGTLTKARDVQIDHVVPLKNAYTSGAWKWNFEKRCLFANFMNNEFHLKSVDGIENMTKNDEGPDQYIPPNSGYVCQYLEVWLKIKLIWNLEMSASEANAIESEIERFSCNRNAFKISQKQLAEQRKATVDQQKICDPKNLQSHPGFFSQVSEFPEEEL